MADKADIPVIRGPSDLQAAFDLPDVVLERLKTYEDVLKRWQRAVNLVAPGTLPNLWHRHFADSLQVLPLLPTKSGRLADLGSGGGFPGLVIAAALADSSGPHVTLVESDQRKAAFLRDAARAMEISVEILSTRIESDASLQALFGVDVVTARALAPLGRLFEFVAPFVIDTTTCVFLKGREAVREVSEARSNWRFDAECHISCTDPEARVVVIRNLRRHESSVEAQ